MEDCGVGVLGREPERWGRDTEERHRRERAETEMGRDKGGTEGGRDMGWERRERHRTEGAEREDGKRESERWRLRQRERDREPRRAE